MSSLVATKLGPFLCQPGAQAYRSAHTEAKAARTEAEAARAEAAKAKQHVRSLEAKLDVQRDSSMGPEGGLHARREMPKSK